MKKIPRGVYYLSLGRIINSSFKLPFSCLSQGDIVREFELKAQAFTKAKYLKAMPHARISLYYLLCSHRLQKGDEVLMSPTTLPDMVNMILLAGLKPVFVDFKKNNHSIDLEKVSKFLSEKSRVLFLTHLYGILPDMNAIEKFCKDQQLLFIQDCTQAYGCKYDDRPVVDFADSSFFSTCSLKDLHTHMGGLLCTKSLEVMNEVTSLTSSDFTKIKKKYFWKFLKEDIVASLVLNRDVFSLITYKIFALIFKVDSRIIEDLINAKGITVGPFRFFEGLFGEIGDVRRTSIPSDMLYQFTDLQATVGIEQLKKINNFEVKRRENSLLLIKNLSVTASKRLPDLLELAHNSFWRIPIHVDDPREFEYFLFSQGIDPGKTTLPCLPTLSIFKDLKQDTPMAEHMGTHSIFLPNYHYLSKSEILYVAKTVNKYFENKLFF